MANKKLKISFHFFSLDQNRNKTKTKNNQKPANQQSDVISLHTKQEVTRLEALCESRTKELNYARLQMKSNLQAFDAMTVMVQYLSQDVGTITRLLFLLPCKWNLMVFKASLSVYGILTYSISNMP